MSITVKSSIRQHQHSVIRELADIIEAIWQRYHAELQGLPLTLPAAAPAGDRHGLHLYPIRLNADAPLSRDAFLSAMHNRNIGTGVHYLAIPEHPFYQRRFGWQPDEFAAARDAGRQCVSLPLSAALSDNDVTDVVDAVRALLA